MSQNKTPRSNKPFGNFRKRLADKLRRPDRSAQLAYYDNLIYQHRSFDVKGLTTQGVYTLELENVFVDLALVPRQRQRASADPLRTISKQFNKGRHDLWAYISSEKSRTRDLVILGAPGSGKTTLLKHVTLTLAAETQPDTVDKKIDAIPILLFLRDHAAMIAKYPRYSIIDALQEKLTLWQLEMPENWFANALEKGQCLLMLDGLDEVADLELRKKVVRWVEQQMQKYAKNRFIITSRPFGYYSNPLKNGALLEIRPFTIEQVKKFINNWYLANEIMSFQHDDPGVRMEAKRGADDLLWRLRQVPVLLEMAINPLLLTMIATVHRYRSSLPGRRVELYSEICEVFLGKRQQARGIQFDLTPAQKQRVLQSLAYYMMFHKQREIELKEAAFAIQQPLKRVIGTQQNGKHHDGEENTSEAFLKTIENSSGLLIEREAGVYSFAHLTFQEYLASAHILDQKLESTLVKGVEDSWWHETTRLYTAQADATNIIEACLSRKPASVPALMLAMECLDEAREVRPDLRNIVARFAKSVDHKNPEVRQITAEVVLSLRLRRMVRIDENKYVDTTLISNAEYQLFLNDAQLQHHFHQPDHWKTTQYKENSGQTTITGMRPSDAVAFCDWLTARESGEWQYRLPTQDECRLGVIESNQTIIGKSAVVGYWYKGKSRYQLTPFTIDSSLHNLEKLWIRRLEDDWDLNHNQPAENFKLVHHLITSRVKKRRYAILNPDRNLSQPLAAYPQLLQDNSRIHNRSQRDIASKLDQALVAAIRIVNNPNLDIARQLNLDDVIELAEVLHQALTNATDLALPRGLTTEISRSAQYAQGMLGNRQVVMFQELDRALNKALRLTRDLTKLVKRTYVRARTRIRAESLAQLSELLAERERRITANITNAGEGSKKEISILADLYIDVALLEERMARKLPAFEGIRIVKVRQ